MYNPPAQYGRGLNITYPRGHLLHSLVSGLKFSGFHDTKTSVNKRLLCNCFFTLPASTLSGINVMERGTVFNILNSNSLQRYNFFLKYANNKSIKFVVCEYHAFAVKLRNCLKSTNYEQCGFSLQIKNFSIFI